jgi:hypothetical protein
MSRYLVKRVTETENFELLANTEVRELTGEDRLEGIVVEDNRSGARRTLGVRSVFVFIGAQANTGWLRGAVELGERGFVLTGEALDRYVLDRNESIHPNGRTCRRREGSSDDPTMEVFSREYLLWMMSIWSHREDAALASPLIGFPHVEGNRVLRRRSILPHRSEMARSLASKRWRSTSPPSLPMRCG